MLSLTKDSMEHDAGSGYPGSRYCTCVTPLYLHLWYIYDYKYTTVMTFCVIKIIYEYVICNFIDIINSELLFLL